MSCLTTKSICKQLCTEQSVPALLTRNLLTHNDSTEHGGGKSAQGKAASHQYGRLASWMQSVWTADQEATTAPESTLQPQPNVTATSPPHATQSETVTDDEPQDSGSYQEQGEAPPHRGRSRYGQWHPNGHEQRDDKAWSTLPATTEDPTTAGPTTTATPPQPESTTTAAPVVTLPAEQSHGGNGMEGRRNRERYNEWSHHDHHEHGWFPPSPHTTAAPVEEFRGRWYGPPPSFYERYYHGPHNGPMRWSTEPPHSTTGAPAEGWYDMPRGQWEHAPSHYGGQWHRGERVHWNSGWNRSGSGPRNGWSNQPKTTNAPNAQDYE